MNRPANKRPALDAAIVFSLYFRRHWRGATQAGRSATLAP
jgi:hypothetical protein